MLTLGPFIAFAAMFGGVLPFWYVVSVIGFPVGIGLVTWGWRRDRVRHTQRAADMLS
jgi:hypothetical protein